MYSLTRSFHRAHEEKLTTNIKTNPKTFWKYIYARLKVRPTVNCLQNPDGSMTHSNSEIAKLFNNHFVSVLTKENVTSLPSFHLDHPVLALNNIS